jgi:hypothetical protein
LRFRRDEAGRVRDDAESVPDLLRIEMTGMSERGFAGFPLEERHAKEVLEQLYLMADGRRGHPELRSTLRKGRLAGHGLEGLQGF